MARRKGRLESTALVFAPITAPTATVLDFAGTVAPSGWLLCAGQEVSRTTYATLFATIGITYGAGNGTTTFNLPDLRGRVAAGKDDMNGTPANRLTGTLLNGVNGNTLGNSGGNEGHFLTQQEMPSHSHTQPAHTHSYSGYFQEAGGGATFNGRGFASNSGQPGGYPLTEVSSSAAPTTNATGNGLKHNVAQPTIILNKIIKT